MAASNNNYVSYNDFKIENLIFGDEESRGETSRIPVNYKYDNGVVDALEIVTPVFTSFGIRETRNYKTKALEDRFEVSLILANAVPRDNTAKPFSEFMREDERKFYDACTGMRRAAARAYVADAKRKHEEALKEREAAGETIEDEERAFTLTLAKAEKDHINPFAKNTQKKKPDGSLMKGVYDTTKSPTMTLKIPTFLTKEASKLKASKDDYRSLPLEKRYNVILCLMDQLDNELNWFENTDKMMQGIYIAKLSHIHVGDNKWSFQWKLIQATVKFLGGGSKQSAPVRGFGSMLAKAPVAKQDFEDVNGSDDETAATVKASSPRRTAASSSSSSSQVKKIPTAKPKARQASDSDED